MRPLVFFDIDGTILSTAKAGYYAYLEAFNLTHFNTRESVAAFDVDFAGKTDKIIYEDLLAQNNISNGTSSQWDAFVQTYVEIFAERTKCIEAWRVYAGVREAIAYLAPRVALALLTGNIEAGARLKLEPIGLWEHFPVGGFADDGHIRNEVAERAYQKACAYYGEQFDRANTWVIGDTPHDVSCGKHIGANTIAVATGGYDYASLIGARPTICARTLAYVPWAKYFG